MLVVESGGASASATAVMAISLAQLDCTRAAFSLQALTSRLNTQVCAAEKVGAAGARLRPLSTGHGF